MATAMLAARKRDLVQELNRYIEQKKQYTLDVQSRTALMGEKGLVHRELSASEKMDGAPRTVMAPLLGLTVRV